MSYENRVEELIDAGNILTQWGMVPATSGNFSARVNDKEIAITVSGKHKGQLTADDIMRIDFQGQSLDGKKSSAETGLHTQIYRRYGDINAVLHVHSIASILLSRCVDDTVVIQNHELLKAFPGINTHECEVRIPIYENDQDIDRLAALVDSTMNIDSDFPAYLIRGHGLYAWSTSVTNTINAIEALDFLFKCEWAERKGALI